MTDHQPLHDAFAEYERRADALGSARVSPSAPPARSKRTPVLLIAASAVLVLAVAGGVVWLAAGSGTTRGSGRPALGAPAPSPSPTSTPGSGASVPPTAVPAPNVVPIRSQAAPPGPTSSATHVNGPVSVPTQPPVSSSAPPRKPGVPTNAEQMRRAFSRVLGDTASFTVDQHHGNYLIGTLTATTSGAQGGYDIQASNGKPGDTAICEDLGKGSHCTISKPAAGGSLAVERETSDGGGGATGGVLYFVDYVFPDGATYLVHLSNLADPKGAGQNYGAKPPLTLKQLTTIVESPLWSDQ